MSDITKYNGILLTKLDVLIPGQLYQIKIPLYLDYLNPSDVYPTLEYGEKILMIGPDRDKYKEVIYISSRSGVTWAFLDQCGRKWWDFEDKLKWKLIPI